MKTFSVLLPDTAAVKLFVNIVEQCDFDVDLVSGRYRINAKSMMGILSLGTGVPMEMEIRGSEEEAAELLSKVDMYLVKE